MDPDVQRALAAIEDAAEKARSDRVDLTDDYLSLLARVEAMPQNQSGAVKSSRWIGSYAEHRRWFADVRLVRPKR
jgi:hypothetical protein